MCYGNDFSIRYISKIPVIQKRPSIQSSCIIVTLGEAVLTSVPQRPFEFVMLTCCLKHLSHHTWVTLGWTNYRLQYTVLHNTLPLYWPAKMKAGDTGTHWYTYKWFLLHTWSNWILYTLTLWSWMAHKVMWL
jgi:hypothetical protein